MLGCVLVRMGHGMAVAEGVRDALLNIHGWLVGWQSGVPININLTDVDNNKDDDDESND